MQELAPIILFVYKRPRHTRQTIEALSKNRLAKKSELFIFSDAPKSADDEKGVNDVRDYIRNISGFRKISVKLRKTNYGLARSVIEGINEIFQNYDRVIVLEDDIVTSPKFLDYMNKSLDYFQEIKSIYSISGYSFPIKFASEFKGDIYFLRRSSSWGWATWKNRWDAAVWDNSFYEKKIANEKVRKNFNRGGSDLTPMLIKQINNKIDSWAIRWAFTHYLNNGYCVFPKKSLVQNIGTDATGTNFDRKSSRYEVDLDYSDDEIELTDEMNVDDDIERQVRKIVRPGIITRIKYSILSLFGND